MDEEVMNTSSEENSRTSETQNEEYPMHSDSDSDSSSDDEDRQLEQQAEELEKQICENKYLYDAHVQLIEIYRKLGDLKSLREACERFRECFPLTPAIWLSWIKDEIKIASSDEEKKRIIDLFDLAVRDYLSVELWQEYAQYSIGVLELEKVREILQRGLNTAGTHVSHGCLLWDTLRELELAHLSIAQPETEEWRKQLERVYDVFKRQLSVPLLGMESTHYEFEQWLEQLPAGHGLDKKAVDWGYERALKNLEKYKPFEDRLRIAVEEDEIRHIYKEYIKVVSDPSTVLNLYERAVAQLCLNSEVWADYCSYTFKLGEVSLSVSERALRNCPWSENLWVWRLRILENHSVGEEEIMKHFEQGVSCVSPPALELWLAYIEYTRRNSKSPEKVHKLFEQAIEQVGRGGDPTYKLLRWHARILASEEKMEQARKCWGDILKDRQHRECATVWLEYLTLERRCGDTKHLRVLFQKALGSCKDWPQYIMEEWTMFERETGTLQDMLKCHQKCDEIKQSLVVTAATSSQASENTEKSSNGEFKGRKRKSDAKSTEDGASFATKRQKTESEPPKPRKIQPKHEPSRTVFVSNLSPHVTEEDLKTAFPNAEFVDLVLDKRGVSKRFAYVQLPSEEDVKPALDRDREPLMGRPLYISKCKASQAEEKQHAFKYSTALEKKKLFIRGLPLKYSKTDLEELFKPFGCTDVRLITYKSGQPKGLAYVEFADEEAASEAMKAKDGCQLGTHTISVEISAPPPKRKQKEPTRHARSRLQVPLVPRVVQRKAENAPNGSISSSSSKSNEDFRKMLLDKKSE